MNIRLIEAKNIRKIITEAFKRWGLVVVLKEIVNILEDSEKSEERELGSDIKAAVKKFEKKGK